MFFDDSTSVFTDLPSSLPPPRHPPGGGTFTISLDFELYWGVRDKYSLAEYGPAILGGREAIPRILDLFFAHDIHATWATVGFLFHATKEELLGNCPDVRPAYGNRLLDPYASLEHVGENEERDPYHFGSSLIRRIASCPDQEIASHTYSHYYCLEDGQSEASFRADLMAAQQAAKPYGIQLRSLVFPRNQYNPDYDRVLAECGIVAYRGNPPSWIYREGSDSRSNRILRRMGRMTDAFLPLVRTNKMRDNALQQLPLDIPANRFFRVGRNGLAVLDRLHMRRIKAEMTYAAINGMNYHLWWHPHNFGLDTDTKLRHLQNLLDHYLRLQSGYGMRSMSMCEVASRHLSARARTLTPTIHSAESFG